jgi:hypothetical protein
MICRNESKTNEKISTHCKACILSNLLTKRRRQLESVTKQQMNYIYKNKHQCHVSMRNIWKDEEYINVY